MRLLSLAKSFFQFLFQRRQIDAELDDELRSTVELLADQKVQEGVPPAAARRAARIELGGVEQIKEEVRAARAGAWLDTLLQDVRFGLRMLRKNPGFAAVAILTVALGIGANTAIFSVVNAVLLRPLPIPNPVRVVALHDHFPALNLPRVGVSALQFRDYSAYTKVFESTALDRYKNFNLSTGGQTRVVRANRVTASLFPLLGIRPILGQTFSPTEDMNPNAHVTVLSAGLWHDLFAGNPSAIGKSVRLDGIDYRIIGVLPQSMTTVDPASQLWVPMGLTPKDFTEDNRWTVIFGMYARLRPGVSIQQARAAMAVEAKRVKGAAATNPADHKFVGVLKGFGIGVHTLDEELVGNVSQPLYLLLGAVLFVLLIACANVANLLLARGTARSHEIAIRVAIGAGRRRLIAQLLTEALLLSCFGGALGLLFAVLGIRLLVHNAPASIPDIAGIGVDPVVLGFTITVSIIAALLFGLIPAMQAGKIDLTHSLNQTSGHGNTRLSRGGLGRVLMVSEVALTCVLLVGSGLLVRTLANLLRIDLGFHPADVLTLRISPSGQKLPPADVASFASILLDRVSSLPGVLHAALALDPPLFGDETSSIYSIRGYNPGPDSPQPHAVHVYATPDYFAATGIPLLRGRIYSPSEMQTAGSVWHQGSVVVIDEAMAERFWPNENPVGQQIGYADNHGQWATIVGVVGTVRNSTLVSQSKGMIYVPLYSPGATLVVRTASDPRPLISAIRDEVHAVDPSQAVYDVQTMSHRVADSVAQQRFAASLLALFAALSVVLASIGLYSVMSYVVGRRTHEIGIRMALGAQPGNIVRNVLVQGGRMAVAGIAVGLVASFELTRLLKSMLFGVSATDPLTFAAVIALLLAVALLACWVPARRAMRVDPMATLRHE